MSYLIVLTSKHEKGAEAVRDEVLDLQKQHIVELEDAAVVVRKQDGKVKIKQAYSLVGQGAMGGAFWGLLIGFIFWVPWLGMALGALSGALGGMFADIGVDDNFIKKVGNTIEAGHSALFLLVREATLDKLTDALKKHDVEILQTSLSKEQENRLREIFGADEVQG